MKKKLVDFTLYIFAAIGFFLVSGYLAVTYGLTNTNGIIDTQAKNFLPKATSDRKYSVFPLAHTEEWISFRLAVAKDEAVIRRVSKETGVPPRLLIAVLVPEQMRLFYTDRPVFKQFFQPLRILGSQSQFSWGIFGIKEDTALQIEANLRNPKSPFYLGKKNEGLLTYTDPSTGTTSERFARITDQRNHYYTYLYTALYIAQIQKQWSSAGYPINGKPEILATLWNLGFSKSKPNSNPKSGGAEIEIGGQKYSFGSLASLFYYSDEMIELFPITEYK